MLTEVFFTVLEISLSLSVVILLLLLISFRINKNYIAKWKYWIWLVIAIRLLLPFNLTIPQAPMQFEFPQSQVFTSPASTPIQPAEPSETVDAAMTSYELPNDSPIQPGQPTNTTSPSVATTDRLTLSQLASLIWLAGIIVFLTYHAIGYHLFKKRALRWSYPNQQVSIKQIYKYTSKELNINRQIPVIISDNVYSPMMLGFLKPILILPQMNYSETELYYILKHELIHYKRRDVWYKLFMLMANAFHWFNPLVYLMFRQASKDLEISCDAEVLKTADDQARKQYTEMIMNSVNEQMKRRHTVLSSDFGGGIKMLKERFVHIRNGKKKRKGIWVFMLLLICIVVVGFLIGCNERSEPSVDPSSSAQTETAQRYVNEDLGFALTFPAYWIDKYTAGSNPNNDENVIQFDYNGGFNLFTIERIAGEDILQEELIAIPPAKIVMQGNGYTYVAYTSGDVQVPVEKGEEAIREYKEMYSGIDDLLTSIQVVGQDEPLAHVPGYKVIGTGYFQAEVPKTWDLIRSEQDLIWSLQQGDEHIGEIRFVVWDGQTASTADENSRYQSMIKDGQKASIQVFSAVVDQQTFDQIVASFEFRGGAYSVIDMESYAAQYVKAGAEKWFGMIKGFHMKDGKPVSVDIELMEFISDTDDNYPNGFRIERLNTIRTVDLMPEAEVAPLINGASYGLYQMPHIESWIDEDGQLREEYAANDFTSTYYDFIVRNGVVTHIFGHYVP